MCRNIKTLFNFEPPATDEEIRAASLQFVRKLSGFNKPSRANEAIFEQAIDETAVFAHRLLDRLTTNAAPRNRDVEAERARARANSVSGKWGAHSMSRRRLSALCFRLPDVVKWATANRN